MPIEVGGVGREGGRRKRKGVEERMGGETEGWRGDRRERREGRQRREGGDREGGMEGGKGGGETVWRGMEGEGREYSLRVVLCVN